jgi:amino acid permease
MSKSLQKSMINNQRANTPFQIMGNPIILMVLYGFVTVSVYLSLQGLPIDNDMATYCPF